MGGLIVPASALVLGAATILALRLRLPGVLEPLATVLLLSQAVVTVVLLVAGVGIQSLAAPVLLALAAIAAAASLAPGRRGWEEARAGARRFRAAFKARQSVVRQPLVMALIALVVLAVAWRAVLAVRLPVLDYDGFSYHMVTVDVWLQGGVIGRVPQRIWSDGYPSNGELVSLWLVAFGRSDSLANLTGLLPLPLAAVALAGLARRLGARLDWALVAAGLFVIAPAVIAMADTTYVDNLAVADLLAVWFFGLSAVRAAEPGQRRVRLVLTGIAMGLAVGTKASALIPAAALGAVLVVEAALHRSTVAVPPWRTALRRAVMTGVTLAVPVVAFGGFWYLKDLVVFGNPMWPFTIGPFTGLARIEDLIVQTPPQLAGLARGGQIWGSWIGDLKATSYTFDTRIGGFGFGWFLALAIGLAGLGVLVRQRAVVPAVAIVVPAAVALLIMPMPWWPRLTLFVPAIVLALGAVALSNLRRSLALGLGGILLVTSVYSLAVVTRTSNLPASPSGSRPAISTLVRLVRQDAAKRADLGLWHECAGFGAIPAGARVTSDGFTLAHLIAGQHMDRILAPLVVATPNGPDLAAAARAIKAEYAVLLDPVAIAGAVGDPADFQLLGPVCRGVTLFAVRPQSGE